MITHVKHLQEALQRFNPEAQLSDELEVQSVSPWTDCNIRSASFCGKDSYETRISTLEDEIEKLEGIIGEIKDVLDSASPNIEDIRSLVDK